MNFLPDDYEAPRTGGGHYMKLQNGENRFRILSQPIVGWEDWLDGKPVRFRMNQKPAQAINPEKAIKHFWAMIVWDYADESIKILQLTQAGIRKALQAYTQDKDWGAPYFYDLKITRSGAKMETEYTVMACPGKPVGPEVRAAFHAKPIRLEALYTGDDPFAPGWDSYTKGIFDPVDAPAKGKKVEALQTITVEQLQALEDHFSQDEEHRQAIMQYLRKKGIERLNELTPKDYAPVLDAVQKRQKAKSMAANTEQLPWE